MNEEQSGVHYGRLLSRCFHVAVMVGAVQIFVAVALHASVYAAGKPARASALTMDDAKELKAALAAYDNGDGKTALPVLRRIAVKYPAHFAANEALGLALLEDGSGKDAVTPLERAVRAEPRNSIALANLGAAYMEVGRPSDAVVVLRKSTSLDPKNMKTMANLGHALFQNNRPNEAVDAFATVRKFDAEDADNTFNLMTAMYASGKDEAALTLMRTFPKASESDAVQMLWGDLAERRGLYKEAAEHMQMAVRLNPSEPNVYALVVELLRHWAWETAASVAKFGVSHYPDSRRLQLATGIAYYGNGLYGEASSVFAALLQSDPTNENVGGLLGKSCSAAGGAAVAECDALLAFAEKHPANAQVGVYAAITILHKPSSDQHLDEAERLLQQAIRMDPKLAEGYYQLAVLQQQKLAWQASADSLTKAIALRPAYAEAHYRLARAYAHTNRSELAHEETVLQQKYAQQEKDDANTKLKEVTTFLLASH